MSFFFTTYLSCPLRLALYACMIIGACLSANASAAKTDIGPSPFAQGGSQSCVILLHGLARSHRSMKVLEHALQAEGYYVINHGYPSRKEPIHSLAKTLDKPISQCRTQAKKSHAEHTSTIHFVTHSLGGILLRTYLAEKPVNHLGRVVMLGPPNQGSEVVDALKDVPGFEILNGPAGLELGTGRDSLPKLLGSIKAKHPHLQLGVIAGNKSINPILSQILPKPNDGKVSVASTKVDGMSDHIVLPVTHTFMMRDDQVIEQIMHFLEFGWFKPQQ